jgi:RNA polymerase sigma factor (sigma-70 family)
VAFRATLDDFGAFYEATYPRAYRTALAIIGDTGAAADATQDAYLSAYRGRTGFRGDVPAEAWLLRIVVHSAISATRRQRVRWIEPLPEGLAGSVDESLRSVDRLSLLSALQGLPVKERAALVLRFYGDLDYASIATCLNTNVGTVGSWLSRGIERMRVDLAGPGPVATGTRPAEDGHGY